MSQKDRGAILALVEVSRDDCRITNFVTREFENASVEPLRLGETSTLHRVESIHEPYLILQEMQKIAVNVMRVGKNGMWAESESCSSCKFLIKCNIVVLSTRTIDSTRIIYRLLVQNETKLRILERNLNEAGLKPNILSTEYENQLLLTEREKEVVHMAYRHGYYDPERGISMTDVAKMMKVSTPSLSDVLRRGTKKMVKSYVDSKL